MEKHKIDRINELARLPSPPLQLPYRQRPPFPPTV